MIILGTVINYAIVACFLIEHESDSVEQAMQIEK